MGWHVRAPTHTLPVKHTYILMLHCTCTRLSWQHVHKTSLFNQHAVCPHQHNTNRDKTHGSFSSSDQLSQRDYDTDALVVHMGGFIAPTGGNSKPLNQFTTSTSDNSTQSADDDDGDAEGLADLPPVSAAAAARAARRRNKRRASMEGRAGSSGKGRVHLQLYSIAAPAMRRQAQHTSELGASSAWCQPVRVKPGWLQVQKNYFQAPGRGAFSHLNQSCCVCQAGWVPGRWDCWLFSSCVRPSKAVSAHGNLQPITSAHCESS